MKEEKIYHFIKCQVFFIFGVLHSLFYSVLTIVNLAQSISPLLQIWKTIIDFPKVSEQINGGVPRIQLDELQNQN